jgi:uncharacterized protein (TIGR02453 family)
MKKVMEFLGDMRENNNREWFEANKGRYEEAKGEFEVLMNRVIASVYRFDPTIGNLRAKDCVFRIYRDVRFSKDKLPYKTNMGGFVSRGGRKGLYAGYYVHAEPGGSMLAGGIYMPPADVLKKVRQEVYFHADEFKGILNDAAFKKTFRMMEEDKLKKPPKDFPADFADIDLLKYKSYTVLHGVSDETVTSADYVEYAVKVFMVMFPFNAFLNRGIGMEK